MNHIKSKFFMMLLFTFLSLAACSSNEVVTKDSTKEKNEKTNEISIKDEYKGILDEELPERMTQKEYDKQKDGFKDSMVPKNVNAKDKLFFEFVKAMNTKDLELFNTLWDPERHDDWSVNYEADIYINEGNENEYVVLNQMERADGAAKTIIGISEDEYSSEWGAYTFIFRDYSKVTENVTDELVTMFITKDSGEWKIYDIYRQEDINGWIEDIRFGK